MGAIYVYESTVWGASWHKSAGYNFAINASRVVPTANENRPINVAVRWLIRALV